MNAKSLIDRDLASVWHPCSQMSDYLDFPPLPVVSASGCRLRLADGREILDNLKGFFSVLAEWQRSEAEQARAESAAATTTETPDEH